MKTFVDRHLTTRQVTPLGIRINLSPQFFSASHFGAGFTTTISSLYRHPTMATFHNDADGRKIRVTDAATAGAARRGQLAE